MRYVASIGTHLPCWNVPQHWVADDDVAQVHDFFTCVDLISYEDLRLRRGHDRRRWFEGGR